MIICFFKKICYNLVKLDYNFFEKGVVMTAQTKQEIRQEKQDTLDYAYIEKLKTKSERQLKTMLDTLEKETIKITAEKEKLENRLKEKIKRGHFIKDALMEKWRTPSKELLEAIKEVEKGEVVSFDNHQQAMDYLNAEN